MSATISDKVMMKEVLKATGFDCPQGMENKTFEQATSGGGGGGSGTTIEPITITQNGTTTAPSGKAYSPITVNVPSNCTVEELTLDKDSDPVTISYEGKTFVFLGSGDNLGELTGIGGIVSNLSGAGLTSVPITSAGITAGTVSSDPNAKTITFTPDTSFDRGSYKIIKVII